MTTRRTIIRTIPFLILVFIVLGYALFNSRSFIEGPKIVLDSPQETSFFDPRIILSGHTKNIKSLFLDDRQISISHDGIFKEKLLLLPGYNIIEIRGIDTFGREKIQMIELVLLQNIDIDTIQEPPTVDDTSTSSVTIEETAASTTINE